jgi:D-glycero-alpha-D-manno-heptose 1-phosphate guanylyltransferase
VGRGLLLPIFSRGFLLALVSIPLGVTAALLVGGLGTRLKPVVSDRPKVLAEVNSRPFLEVIFRQLIASDVRTAVLLTGYKGSCVQEALGSSFGSLEILYSHEERPLGTAGALRNAEVLFGTEPILVMNGDSYCDVDLRSFFEWHSKKNPVASLVLSQVPDAARFGSVVTDEEGRVTRFIEKGQDGPGWINAGIYFVTRRLIESIPPMQTVSLERQVFPKWVGQGLYAYKTTGGFLDIGTPGSYAEAEKFFRKDV